MLSGMLLYLSHLLFFASCWLAVVVPSLVWRIHTALKTLRARPLNAAAGTDGPGPERVPSRATRRHAFPSIFCTGVPFTLRAVDFDLFHLALRLGTARPAGCGITLKATGPRHLRRSRLLQLRVRVGRPVKPALLVGHLNTRFSLSLWF
jgi:hypothetical protein